MEAPVARLFTDDVRNALARSFGAEAGTLKLLGDFENYVFGYELEGQRRVLRISHASHRSAEQIEAELHWVDFLVGQGVRLARPLRSLSGALTHTVGEDDAVFHAAAFEWAPGAPAEARDWTPGLFRNWGRFLGRCHALTRSYTPPAGSKPRHSWSDDPYIAEGRNWIPDSEVVYRDQWDQIWGEIAGLPRSPDSYGICHTDLHQSNFHVVDGEIHGFDTDDCCQCWFVEDISSVFFYGSRHPAVADDLQKFMEWAWPAFWRGYQSEHRLDPEWLNRIHLFQRARALTLYALIHMKFERGSEERESYLVAQRKHLDTDRPVLDVSFTDVE